MNMKRILQRGFTLAELMIVITIVAILSALSVSMYRSQITKQKVSEGATFAQYIQAPVQNFTVEEGRFPSTEELYVNLKLTDDPSGKLTRFKYINRLLSEIKRSREGVNGALYVVFSSEGAADLAGKVIKLEYNSAQIEGWSCITDLRQAPIEKCALVKRVDVPATAGAPRVQI
jgi:prepilin-type N-terminal cleavage/methylation domain-containing protein